MCCILMSSWKIIIMVRVLVLETYVDALYRCVPYCQVIKYGPCWWSLNDLGMAFRKIWCSNLAKHNETLFVFWPCLLISMQLRSKTWSQLHGTRKTAKTRLTRPSNQRRLKVQPLWASSRPGKTHVSWASVLRHRGRWRHLAHNIVCGCS